MFTNCGHLNNKVYISLKVPIGFVWYLAERRRESRDCWLIGGGRMQRNLFWSWKRNNSSDRPYTKMIYLFVHVSIVACILFMQKSVSFNGQFKGRWWLICCLKCRFTLKRAIVVLLTVCRVSQMAVGGELLRIRNQTQVNFPCAIFQWMWHGRDSILFPLKII